MFKDSSQRQSELADRLTEENAKLQIKIEDYLKDKQKREVQLEKIEMEVSLYIISKYVETYWIWLIESYQATTTF